MENAVFCQKKATMSLLGREKPARDLKKYAPLKQTVTKIHPPKSDKTGKNTPARYFRSFESPSEAGPSHPTPCRFP